jgi:hypothetical protein
MPQLCKLLKCIALLQIKYVDASKRHFYLLHIYPMCIKRETFHLFKNSDVYYLTELKKCHGFLLYLHINRE